VRVVVEIGRWWGRNDFTRKQPEAEKQNQNGAEASHGLGRRVKVRSVAVPGHSYFRLP
jgi:hypothetical protein